MELSPGAENLGHQFGLIGSFEGTSRETEGWLLIGLGGLDQCEEGSSKALISVVKEELTPLETPP
jgi:hypothetical protein